MFKRNYLTWFYDQWVNFSIKTIIMKKIPWNTAKLSDDEIEPIEFPEPKFRVAVKAQNTADEEKMGRS